MSIDRKEAMPSGKNKKNKKLIRSLNDFSFKGAEVRMVLPLSLKIAISEQRVYSGRRLLEVDYGNDLTLTVDWLEDGDTSGLGEGILIQNVIEKLGSKFILADWYTKNVEEVYPIIDYCSKIMHYQFLKNLDLDMAIGLSRHKIPLGWLKSKTTLQAMVSAHTRLEEYSSEPAKRATRKHPLHPEYKERARILKLPFGFMNEAWIRFKCRFRDGDEVWWFDSGKESWEKMGGQAGYALVRDGEVIDCLTTLEN